MVRKLNSEGLKPMALKKEKRVSIRKKPKKFAPAFPQIEWGKDGEDQDEPNLDNTPALTPGKDGK